MFPPNTHTTCNSHIQPKIFFKHNTHTCTFNKYTIPLHLNQFFYFLKIYPIVSLSVKFPLNYFQICLYFHSSYYTSYPNFINLTQNTQFSNKVLNLRIWEVRGFPSSHNKPARTRK